MKTRLLQILFKGALFFLSLMGFLSPSYASKTPDVPIEIHVALTTNLPEETIRSLTLEAKNYNARCVLRGIPLTEDEVKTLNSRGHFGEAKAIQEENRAILRRGFKRLNDFAQNGIVLEIDPPFFRELKIDVAPTILFKRGDELISLSGIPSIKAALHYAIENVNQNSSKEFVKALETLEEEAP